MTDNLPLHSRTSVPLPPLVLLFACLAIFAVVARPHIIAGQVPGDPPDSLDYAYGAAALLHGHYIVQWVGPPSMGTADSNGVAHVPRYPPGYSILLMPAVALWGVAGAVWVNYFSGILLGVLAAWLAARLGGAWAAPLAVVSVLCSIGAIAFSHTVMSDLPTATLVMLELLVLIVGRTARSALLAGLLAGALVWIRLPNLVLLLAGLAGLTAMPDRRRAVAFLGGALLFPVLLGLWQFTTFGSPLTTGYEALHIGPNAHSSVASLFRWQYVFGQPFGRSGLAWNWNWSNALLYPLTLLGFKFWLALPGVGLLGLFAALSFARQTGERGVAGRFTIVALIATMAIYLPYFWQSVRFMLVPAVLLNMLTAVVVAPWLTAKLIAVSS
jgi:hypothetical protein